MTLTELAKKHNLDSDKAVAFLRDWLYAQPTITWHVADSSDDYTNAAVPLIARPELGDL